MTPPEPLKKPAPMFRPSEEVLEQQRKEGWEYIEPSPFLRMDPRWEKLTWTWNYQIRSVIGLGIGREGQ